MHVADVLRETSSPGTATTSGPTNKLYATSADTRAISRTWCLPNEVRCMVTFHSANGGGCIKSGPFKEYVPLIRIRMAAG
jgi:hypothetical protein